MYNERQKKLFKINVYIAYFLVSDFYAFVWTRSLSTFFRDEMKTTTTTNWKEQIEKKETNSPVVY